jgi:hypothetical protein
VQILWINMVTAVALGLTLAFEPPERDVMRRPPRPPEDLDLDRALLRSRRPRRRRRASRGRPGLTSHSTSVPASMSAPSERRRRCLDLRQRRLLEVLRVGDRHLGAADARDRRVELVERLLTMRAAISAERLPLRQPSSTITARCVRAPRPRIVASSSGRSTRRSITSASMPSAASSLGRRERLAGSEPP